MSKKIPLTGKRGAGNFAIVDDVDYEELSKFKWHYATIGYAARYAGGGRKNACYVYMHRQIMNPPDNTGIDHIDGDKLNNCRSNLRLANQSQNNQNARPRHSSTSRYKGVYWDEYHGRWSACIHTNNRKIYLGRYITQKEAALAYNAAAIEYFGEYACLNNIVDDPFDIPVAEPSAPKSSCFLGVTWDKSRNLWYAKIQVNGRCINIGRFADEIEAANARDSAARFYHGDKAKLNFPHDAIASMR